MSKFRPNKVVAMCDVCHVTKNVTDQKMLVCGACRVRRYCSRECQIKDWKEHKIQCKDLPECMNVVKRVFSNNNAAVFFNYVVYVFCVLKNRSTLVMSYVDNTILGNANPKSNVSTFVILNKDTEEDKLRKDDQLVVLVNYKNIISRLVVKRDIPTSHPSLNEKEVLGSSFARITLDNGNAVQGSVHDGQSDCIAICAL